MSPHVVKIEPKYLANLKKQLLATSEAYEVDSTSKYEDFRVKHYGQSIVAYLSGKIVAKGEYAEALLQNTIREMYTTRGLDFVTIGSDEAGKGEWLGPMVIAAVGMNQLQSATLRSLGVMDSKKLPLEKFAHLSNVVKENSLVFKTVLIAPKTFNDRLVEFRAEGKNLNDLLAWGHAKAVSEAYDALSTSNVRIVIDEFSKLKTRLRLERVLNIESVELIQRPRAEDEIAVAAASILARDARETWIDRQSMKLGIDLRDMDSSTILLRDDCESLLKVSYVRK